MWTLILFLTFQSGDVDSVVIKDYPTEKACYVAGKQLIKKYKPTQAKADFSCEKIEWWSKIL